MIDLYSIRTAALITHVYFHESEIDTAVMANLSDGSKDVILFHFYQSEINFNKKDFINITVFDALKIRAIKETSLISRMNYRPWPIKKPDY